jgi:hypothetical protein
MSTRIANYRLKGCMVEQEYEMKEEVLQFVTAPILSLAQRGQGGR